MKHLLLFPVWLIAAVILTLIALGVALYRREFDRGIYHEIWDYKDFVRVVTNKAKTEL